MAKKELDLYFREVDRALVGTKKAKKEFLSGWKNDINEYIMENPTCTVEELRNLYGSPEEVAATFMSSVENHVVKDSISQRRKLALFVIIVCILFLLSCVTYFVSKRISQEHFANGFYVETVAEGKYIPPDKENARHY